MEERHFNNKINQEIGNMIAEDSIFVEDIAKNIARVKELISGHSQLFTRIENVR